MAMTSIPVEAKIRDRLRRYGIAGETYNQILARLMDDAAERALVAWMDHRMDELRDEDWVDLEDIE